MEQDKEIELQLWEYIDGFCTEADRQRISGLIANEKLWQQKFNELTALHNTLTESMELEQPSMRFSKNVMDAVEHTAITPATRKYINPIIIKLISGFFIFSCVAVLAYAIVIADWKQTDPTLFKSVSFSRVSNFFNHSYLFNILIWTNLGIGLLLLDNLLRRMNAIQKERK